MRPDHILWGTINRVRQGAVNAEVTLDVAGGRTVTALVTKDSAARLGLQMDESACAVSKSSNVILAAAA